MLPDLSKAYANASFISYYLHMTITSSKGYWRNCNFYNTSSGFNLHNRFKCSLSMSSLGYSLFIMCSKYSNYRWGSDSNLLNIDLSDA